MSSRYASVPRLTNRHPNYRQYFKNRVKQEVVHYAMPDFSNIDQEFLQDLDIINYPWRSGDTWHKISMEFYGRAEYWWVIALVNYKPAEQDVPVGTVVIVPRSIEDVLTRLR